MKKYIALIAFGFVCSGCDTGTRYHFATYADAKSDGTVLGASLPEFMPVSARDIDGWYHVETNEQTAEFAFSESDKASMVMLLMPVGDQKSVCASEGLASRHWSDFRHGDRFEFYYRAKNGLTECLGVSTDRWRAYYWTVPGK